MKLEKLDISTFVRDCWQKKPLMISNPWDKWQNPLSADELAGLACEEEIESRLITSRRTAAETDWKLEHGPISADRFATLGLSDWTLLVQAVDQVVPEVAELLEPFRFIPDWRIDDVMVSYAADGGGVGPHFDQYDVFLIQGAGRRRWQIGGACDEATPLLVHDDLRLLAEFTPTEEWICEPGDILYVPPGLSHNGMAIGEECMTYSIGFRAPSVKELIGYWSDAILADAGMMERFGDPDIALQNNPGEIADEALNRLHQMVRNTLGDRAAFAQWFGEYSSSPKYADIDLRPESALSVAELKAELDTGRALCRSPASRFLFVRKDRDNLTLFVDGHSHDCTGAMARFAEQICALAAGPTQIAVEPDDDVLMLITTLYNQGCIIWLDQMD